MRRLRGHTERAARPTRPTTQRGALERRDASVHDLDAAWVEDRWRALLPELTGAPSARPSFLTRVGQMCWTTLEWLAQAALASGSASTHVPPI